MGCLSFRQSFLNDLLKYPFSVGAVLKDELEAVMYYRYWYYEGKKLRRELARVKQQLVGVEEIRLENARLSKLLSFKEKSPYTVMASKVIAHVPDIWSSALIVDKGTANGIHRGMVVVSYGGLVGRIVQTSASTSTVMLMNDQNFSVSGIIQSNRQEEPSRDFGRITDDEILNQDADIKVGDMVITSGLTDLF